ncbi:hypothetical protein ACWD6R_37275 [Streptomyces sp. NPDC005151]
MRSQIAPSSEAHTQSTLGKGRDAAELTALADHLTAHGLVLEMLAGPLQGMYDPSGPGRLLFGFFAAMSVISSSPIKQGCDLGCQVKDGVFDLAA